MDLRGRARANVMDQNLYQTDFYGWTAQQAEALRCRAFDKADLANIIEEIETLGRSEESALESFYAVLCTHLLKAIHQPGMTTLGWQKSVLNSRLAIGKVIRRNPGLKPKRDEAFAEAYKDARKVASLETALPLERFPVDAPFSREKAEQEDYLPSRLSWSKEELQRKARTAPSRDRTDEA